MLFQRRRSNARNAIVICGYSELSRATIQATFSLLNARIVDTSKSRALLPIRAAQLAASFISARRNRRPTIGLWIRTDGAVVAGPPKRGRLSTTHFATLFDCARCFAASRAPDGPWTRDVSGPGFTVQLPAARGHAGALRHRLPLANPRAELSEQLRPPVHLQCISRFGSYPRNLGFSFGAGADAICNLLPVAVVDRDAPLIGPPWDQADAGNGRVFCIHGRDVERRTLRARSRNSRNLTFRSEELRGPFRGTGSRTSLPFDCRRIGHGVLLNRLPRENASPYRGGKPSLGHLCKNFAFAISLGGPRPAKTFIRIRAILVSQRHDTGPSASFNG